MCFGWPADGSGDWLDAHQREKADGDAANRKAAQAELIKQARGTTPMRLAENAARAAIEQSFAMPLKAAGIDATVTARFASDAG